MLGDERVRGAHFRAEIQSRQLLKRRDALLELLDLVESEVLGLLAAYLERLGQVEIDERRLIRDECGRVELSAINSQHQLPELPRGLEPLHVGAAAVPSEIV